MRYWISNSKTGNRVSVESYDEAITLFDLFFGPSYKVMRDPDMIDVWWVYGSHNTTHPSFMLTNLQPTSHIQIGE